MDGPLPYFGSYTPNAYVHIMEAVMSTFSPNVCLIIGSQCDLGRYDNIVLGIPSASFRLYSILVPAHCHEKYQRI